MSNEQSETGNGSEVSPHLPFPVIGIGASAGGIEALTALLPHIPSASKMAFVIVQHLPPQHESLMAEILRRATTLPVLQIDDNMTVESGTIYVTRPGYTVTIANGRLHLGSPVDERGHRRPIDDFFRSLAAEQGEHAIAVVLSGFGANGTAGAQAIKATGGLCIAQDPDSTEFPGMPSSLIHSGYADEILKPEDIPAALGRYVQREYAPMAARSGDTGSDSLPTERLQMAEMLAILRARTGHDFSGYKRPTLLRRTQRRMSLIGSQTLGEYASVLRERSEEAAALANDLMINVTGFFRDPEAWEAFRLAVIRPLLESHRSNVRAWVSGCATGEEAYSLAMLLSEEITATNRTDLEVKIFATDASEKPLAFARAGIYPGGIEGDISTERLDRFFEKGEHTYRITKHLRDMVIFAPQDVLHDPPFSRLDLCTCRNLLIYLEPESQRRVLALLHFSLREGGYLFLGNAETLGPLEEAFETVNKKWRIYRRTSPPQQQFADWPNPIPRGLPDLRRPGEIATPAAARPSTSLMLQQALFEQFGPPTVVVDRHDRVVFFHGRCGPYLDQPAGEPTRDLFELLRPSLRRLVRGALRQVIHDGVAVTLTDESMDNPSGVVMTVAPLTVAPDPQYFRISFESSRDNAADDAATTLEPAKTQGAANSTSGLVPRWESNSALEEELRLVRRELQSTVEAYEANNEELKAANEEVTSVNEELQSTNEELQSSKEELQSLNEELLTVNGQLRAKILEVEASSNDISNLLSSAAIAVVFLDTRFNVRRFTPAVSDLLHLIPSDIGRPVEHLAVRFENGDLLSDARTVLETLVPIETEVKSHSGRWYLRRTLPYRTANNRIDGVVITFTDISARRAAQQAAQAAQAQLASVIEHMPAAVLIVESATGHLQNLNRQAADLLGQPYPPQAIGKHWHFAFGGLQVTGSDGHLLDVDNWPLARALQTGTSVMNEEMIITGRDGIRRSILVRCSLVRDNTTEVTAMVAVLWDVARGGEGASHPVR
jgi:two-component system CheB/CheR fusion protein